MRFLLSVSCLALAVAVAPAVSATAFTFTPLPSPAGAQAAAPAFAQAPDGTVWLSWVEPAAAGQPHFRLRAARFAPAESSWLPTRDIATAASIVPSSTDVPQLAIAGDGRIHALWCDGRGAAFVAESRDRGATWTAPERWGPDAAPVENVSLTRLADGRVLAAWLDGRKPATGPAVQQLYARILGDPASEERVDARVCDCCPTTLVPLLDGGALLAYRGRSADEVRDIRVARFRGSSWDAPADLSPDGWKITACPVNGPRLATDGSRVAAVWFTAADGEPRVLASYSPDAAGRWLMPLRLDRGRPAGRVDTVLLSDGTVLASWVEADGSAWLRRINPEFAANEPVELAPAGAARGVPRLLLLQDYAGGQGQARLLIVLATPEGLRVSRASIAEGELLASEASCHCTPTPEQLRGFALRGAALSVDAATNRVDVRHAEVPGVFAGGTHTFTIAPLDLAALQLRRPFLARIERRGGEWWLYDLRWLGEPAR
ncbi:sialidase family protein [Opitutus sp. ER46]|uniref:sialidase family protein n=1 Tax=Opitutus sp. ER46 TaxID=2161864 RepID=UPI000D327729|nr:sialidase family protein [Opitutus sp. ER46]PTY00091.1 hypothetical protein DB354_02030 [Opitutus sp. ER46]